MDEYWRVFCEIELQNKSVVIGDMKDVCQSTVLDLEKIHAVRSLQLVTSGVIRSCPEILVTIGEFMMFFPGKS